MRRREGWQLVAAILVWLDVGLILFSSFFTNPRGFLDSILTYSTWFGRAAGNSPHVHPWSFYFHRLLFFHSGHGPVWTEGLLLALAVFGATAGFARRNLAGASAGLARFLAFYTFMLTAIYCLISYKTPWCLLGFWHGAILLAGVGAAGLVRRAKQPLWRMAICLVLLAGAGHLAWLAWQANFEYAADRRNPYVYAQTSPDIERLAKLVKSIAAISAEGRHTLVYVAAPEDDYWPLPWNLRAFDRIGWWQALPKGPIAPITIVSSKLSLAPEYQTTHVMAGYFELRPEVFLQLYVDGDLWKKYVTRKKTAED
jgi:predicted membrane-bound mannosyltransferase